MWYLPLCQLPVWFICAMFRSPTRSPTRDVCANRPMGLVMHNSVIIGLTSIAMDVYQIMYSLRTIWHKSARYPLDHREVSLSTRLSMLPDNTEKKMCELFIVVHYFTPNFRIKCMLCQFKHLVRIVLEFIMSIGYVFL